MITVPPIGVNIEGLEDVLEAGRKYSLRCKVEGARPSPVISWTLQREGKTPEVLQTTVSFNPFISSVVLLCFHN